MGWTDEKAKNRSGPAVPSIDQNMVAVGGDLSVDRLLKAYRSGAFPWTFNPVTWWSPDPRAIFEFGNFHVSKSLGKVLRQGCFRVTFDTAFRRVIESCAEAHPNRESTWIAPAFIEGYTRLHEAGHAHSVECWREDRLVGGLYGVCIGGYFAAESMFHREDNASKVALCHLHERLRTSGHSLFDIQMPTPITLSFGATTIPRAQFLARLARALEQPVRF